MARRDWCKHYTRDVALGNGICDAGVDARNLVGGPDTGWFLRMPCNSANDAPGGARCEKRALPSPKEAEEAEQRAVVKGLAAIDVLTTAKRMGQRSGTIPCPLCKATVHFAKSPLNGHVHARCETDGCLSIME